VSKQPGAIYGEGSETYLRGLIPLVPFTAVIAMPINLFLFVDPGPLVVELAWAVAVSLFATTMLASVALVPMVAELQATGATRASTGLGGLRAIGVRVLFATVPLVIVNAFFVFTWIGSGCAIFIAVRFALFPIAIASEDADATDSLARSWELVGGAWWRTSGVLLGALLPYAAVVFLLSVLNLSAVLTLLFTVVAQALVAPFVVIVLLLLFEAYRDMAEDVAWPDEPRFPSGSIR